MRSCTNTDTRGKIIENKLLKSKISLLNIIEYTHFDMPNGSFSSMDLAFCNPSLFNIIKYSTSTDLHNRNHFARFYNPAKREIQKSWLITMPLRITQDLSMLQCPNSSNYRKVNQIAEEFEELVFDAATKISF